MEDVRFVRGDEVKVTQKRFAAELKELGWKLEEEKKEKPTKAKARAKAKANDDS